MTDETNALSGEQDAIAETEKVEAPTADNSAAQADDNAKKAEQGDKPGDEADEANAKAEEGDDADKSDEDDQPKRNKKSLKERFSELTQKRRDAEREAQFYKAKVERLQKLERPDPNKYDDPDEYSSDLAAYKVRTSEVRDIQESAKDADTRATQVMAQAYQERLMDFAAETPDFHQVAGNPALPITEIMGREIMDSEFGPQVQYFLGKNPREAARIAQMTANQQIREIGRIEARVSSPAPKRITQAPEPIKPVAGKRNTTVPDLHSMDMDEFARRWKEGSIK